MTDWNTIGAAMLIPALFMVVPIVGAAIQEWRQRRAKNDTTTKEN